MSNLPLPAPRIPELPQGERHLAEEQLPQARLGPLAAQAAREPGRQFGPGPTFDSLDHGNEHSVVTASPARIQPPQQFHSVNKAPHHGPASRSTHTPSLKTSIFVIG
jgi:hypothetical protein